MEYVTLGKHGPTVSRVGFGCWPIGGHGWGKVHEETSIAAIIRSVELGVTLFDTADVYGLGRSEEVLGRALRGRRDQAVIATKGGVRWTPQGKIRRDLSADYLVRALDDSLRRLGTDYIDLYQIHWPDGHTPISEAVRVLERCREQGKIRFIGCCNLSIAELDDAAAAGDIVSVQAPYNLVDRRLDADVLPACRRLQISVLAYSTLAQGLLSGKYDTAAKFDPGDVRSRSGYFQNPQNRSLVELAAEVGAKHSRTPTQVAIRWVLDHPTIAVALTGIKTPHQAEENAGIDWALSGHARDELTRHPVGDMDQSKAAPAC